MRSSASNAEIAADDAGAGDQVAVAEHHALGAAGRAGGVEDGGEILADGARSRKVALGRARQHAGIDDGQPGKVHQRRGMAVAKRGIGEQDHRSGIIQDVAHLRRPQQRIDRHADTTGAADRKDRRTFLDRFREQDRDPIAALQPAACNADACERTSARKSE